MSETLETLENKVESNGEVRKSMTRMAILAAFFPKKPGQTTQEFLREMQALSDEEKSELANLAAIEMKVLLKAA